MNKSKELSNTSKLVKDILFEYPESRNSDSLLYTKVCERCNPDALGRPFSHVLLHLKELNLPSFETVRRSRQKVQEIFPEVSARADVEAQRIVNEDAFINYARQVRV